MNCDHSLEMARSRGTEPWRNQADGYAGPDDEEEQDAGENLPITAPAEQP